MRKVYPGNEFRFSLFCKICNLKLFCRFCLPKYNNNHHFNLEKKQIKLLFKNLKLINVSVWELMWKRLHYNSKFKLYFTQKNCSTFWRPVF